jgi:hypothetical protein
MHRFRNVRTGAAVIVLSVLLFALMQLFDASHCLDCGAKVGFPFAYMQDGTYATIGHVIWPGLLGDSAIALTLSGVAVLMLRKRRMSRQRP